MNVHIYFCLHHDIKIKMNKVSILEILAPNFKMMNLIMQKISFAQLLYSREKQQR